MDNFRAYRAVRLTARTSAVLFAAAQAAAALGPAARPARQALYLSFMTAHGVHFAAVTRYGRLTGGQHLFPGGRSLRDVGGWPTVIAIYTAFAGLAVTGWIGRTPARSTATTIIATMFVGTYIGQLPRSPFYAVPAGLVAAATLARVRSARRHQSVR